MTQNNSRNAAKKFRIWMDTKMAMYEMTISDLSRITNISESTIKRWRREFDGKKSLFDRLMTALNATDEERVMFDTIRR